MENKIIAICPECGKDIEVEKNPWEIRYHCKNCGCDYGCDIKNDRM